METSVAGFTVRLAVPETDGQNDAVMLTVPEVSVLAMPFSCTLFNIVADESDEVIQCTSKLTDPINSFEVSLQNQMGS